MFVTAASLAPTDRSIALDTSIKKDGNGMATFESSAILAALMGLKKETESMQEWRYCLPCQVLENARRFEMACATICPLGVVAASSASCKQISSASASY